MKQRPSREAESLSVIQEILSLLLNVKILWMLC